jgi:hypothetical protein
MNQLAFVENKSVFSSLMLTKALEAGRVISGTGFVPLVLFKDREDLSSIIIATDILISHMLKKILTNYCEYNNYFKD